MIYCVTEFSEFNESSSPFRENCNAREMKKLVPVCLYTVRAAETKWVFVLSKITKPGIKHVISSQGRLPLSVIS